MTQKILIVEDEARLASLLADYIRQAGLEPHCLADGLEVLPWVERERPDLILLDLMLPGKDGISICREIRRTLEIPIIMVTARVEEIDRLLGLELGADDYICKPFSPREVVARVKAVLRRTSTQPSQPSLGLSLDQERYKAILNGSDLELTAVEFKLLMMLAEKPGRIFSRDQVMNRIYDDQRVVSDRTIDSHIKKLRKKIAQVQTDAELVHSVYGVGYKYEVIAPNLTR